MKRDSRPEAQVRHKLLVVWVFHFGLTRAKAAPIVRLSWPTVQRCLVAFRTGGLERLRRWSVHAPVSDRVAHATAIREALTTRADGRRSGGASRTLTGIKWQPTQVRK